MMMMIEKARDVFLQVTVVLTLFMAVNMKAIEKMFGEMGFGECRHIRPYMLLRACMETGNPGICLVEHCPSVVITQPQFANLTDMFNINEYMMNVVPWTLVMSFLMIALKGFRS